MTQFTTAERPACIENIRTRVRGVKLRQAKRSKAAPPPDPEDCRYLFTVCTGNRWMELGLREPEPQMLFGEFWHQNELCILFAGTNVGKSVLAVQIGNSIAQGIAIAPFALQAGPANVLYVDFELGTRQFYQRYTHAQATITLTTALSARSLTPIIRLPGAALFMTKHHLIQESDMKLFCNYYWRKFLMNMLLKIGDH